MTRAWNIHVWFVTHDVNQVKAASTCALHDQVAREKLLAKFDWSNRCKGIWAAWAQTRVQEVSLNACLLLSWFWDASPSGVGVSHPIPQIHHKQRQPERIRCRNTNLIYIFRFFDAAISINPAQHISNITSSWLAIDDLFSNLPAHAEKIGGHTITNLPCTMSHGHSSSEPKPSLLLL